MRKPRALFALVIALALLAMMIALVGCGSGASSSAGATLFGGGGDPGGGTGGTSNSLAVADSGNNRVLVFNAPWTTDESAMVVLGQPDFTHSAANQGNLAPGANTLAAPTGVAQGPGGELYVADQGNCRVLRFDPPFQSGMSATVVFGEPDFVTRNCFQLSTATANSLMRPFALAVDSHGDLWVADNWYGAPQTGVPNSSGDSRVLQYVPPFTNGMTASVVLGQATTGASAGCNQGAGDFPHPGGQTAQALCAPYDLAFDPAGDLWIADFANWRILEFAPPFTTDMSASLVLGVPSFTTPIPPSCAYTAGGCPADKTLANPRALAFDPQGDLWVANGDHVMEFVPPFSNYMVATIEVGTPDFATSSNTVFGGWFGGVAFDPSTGDMLVSDRSYHRVLLFVPPFSTGMSPSAVLGQAAFNGYSANQGGSSPSAKTLSSPVHVAALH